MSEKTVVELINALADSRSPDSCREQATLALQSLGQEAVAPLRALLQAQEVDVRWWAARALAAVGGASGVALLIETLSDPDPDVRACAALGLGTIGALEAAEPLSRTMADESTYVGRIASDALIQIGPAAVPTLIEALSKPSARVRIGAARALVPLDSHDAIPALFAALDDESALVTHYAEQALGRMGVGMVLVKPQ